MSKTTQCFGWYELSRFQVKIVFLISCYTTVHTHLFICIIIYHTSQESLTILIIVQNVKLNCLNFSVESLTLWWSFWRYVIIQILPFKSSNSCSFSWKIPYSPNFFRFLKNFKSGWIVGNSKLDQITFTSSTFRKVTTW